MALEALIDVNEVVKWFLRDYYPTWSSYRHSKNISEEVCETVFCNWEEPKVIAVKTFLKENGSTKKKFIEALQSYMIKKRHYMAHQGLLPEERPTAYNCLKKLNDEDIRVAVTTVLYMSIENIKNMIKNQTPKDELYNHMKGRCLVSAIQQGIVK